MVSIQILGLIFQLIEYSSNVDPVFTYRVTNRYLNVLGCCDEIKLHTDRQGSINKSFLYNKIWEKKMLDTYTNRPIYAIKLDATDNYEQHFLYWIKNNNNEVKDTNGAWMVYRI